MLDNFVGPASTRDHELCRQFHPVPCNVSAVITYNTRSSGTHALALISPTSTHITIVWQMHTLWTASDASTVGERFQRQRSFSLEVAITCNCRSAELLNKTELVDSLTLGLVSVTVIYTVSQKIHHRVFVISSPYMMDRFSKNSFTDTPMEICNKAITQDPLGLLPMFSLRGEKTLSYSLITFELTQHIHPRCIMYQRHGRTDGRTDRQLTVAIPRNEHSTSRGKTLLWRHDYQLKDKKFKVDISRKKSWLK